MERGPIRAAVMADTHGVLRPEVERILETCDVIIHAGDFDSQMLYHKLDVGQPLYAVRGNNDRGWSGGLALVRRFEVGGVKFIMAHERADIPSMLGDVQVVIFGHSHMYYQQEVNGRLWLNPGSCGYKRFTLPLSLAVMTIEDGRYEVEAVWLEKGYGTPGAAKAQAGTDKIEKARMEKPRANKYEKQQKRYRQRAVKEDERDSLFMIAKIQRLRKAGETREWVVRNLGEAYKLAGTVYDICGKKPGLNARQVLELIKEQIRSV